MHFPKQYFVLVRWILTKVSKKALADGITLQQAPRSFSDVQMSQTLRFLFGSQAVHGIVRFDGCWPLGMKLFESSR